MTSAGDGSAEQLIARSDAERVRTLLLDSERLFGRFCDASGDAAQLPLLARATDQLRAAHRIAGVDDHTRIEIEYKLGSMLGVWYMQGGGTTQDRDESIALLDATIEKAGRSSVQRQLAWLLLARISLRRTFDTAPGDPVRTVQGCAEWLHALPLAPAMADLDRAERCLRSLAATGPANPEVRDAAAQLRADTGLLREMLTAAGGRDVESITEHLTGLFERLLTADATPSAPQWTVPVTPPEPAPPSPVDERDNEEMRQTLRGHLAAFAGQQAPWGGSPAQLAAALLRPDAGPVGETVADEAVALATAVVEQGSADPVRHATDRFLLGLTLWVRARNGDGGGGWGDGYAASRLTDLRDGAAELVAAARALPVGHPLEAPVLVALAAFLDGFRPLSGVLDSVAEPLAERAHEARPGAGPEQDLLRALTEVCRAAVAVRCGRRVDLTALQATVAAVAHDHPWRHRLLGALASAHLIQAAAGGTEPDHAAVRHARSEADAAMAGVPQPCDDDGLRAMTALANVADAAAGDDGTRLALVGATLAAGSDPFPDLDPDVRFRIRELGRQAVAAVVIHRGGPARGTGQYRHVLTAVADLLAGRGTARSQPPGVAGASAGAEAGDAIEALIDAVRHLGTAPEVLRRARTDALVHLVPGEGDTVMTLTLDVASGTTAMHGPVALPGPFVPSAAGAWCDRAGPVLRSLFDRAHQWRRVALIADGDLSNLPWHCARERRSTGGHRYAGDRAAVTVHRSTTGLGRQLRPVTDDVVFLADPAGGRDAAAVEAMLLRRMFYPRSAGLGNTVERIDGPGTAADLLARLAGPAGPGASLLHLGCAVRSASPPALGLADGWLDLRRVAEQATARPAGAPGGLVILPADAADGSATVAEALLDAGFAAVVDWLWPVEPAVAALMVYRLHAFLADAGLDPADAVRALHTWMRDPDRDPLPGAPSSLAAALIRADLADERQWAAVRLRGR